MMVSVASKVPFYQLAVLLDKIEKKKGTDAKKSLLREFVDEWRKFHEQLHKDDKACKDSFYPAMRLLLPMLEREREAYGIKEFTLAKLYIEILGLGKESPAAKKLLNFKAPKNKGAEVGDFASVAFYILQPRCPEKGNMTLEQVNGHLDEIATANANKNKDGVKKSLLTMLRNMSAKEQKWLIRMIMKDMKMGISQSSVFSVFHQDAEDLFNVKMSLEKVCTMLKDPKVRLHEVEVTMFSPFRPMLGDRGAPSKVEKVFENKVYLIETKFDGERMQMHTDLDAYKYFSRAGNDYTASFGANKWEGTLTPYIANCYQDDVKNCILDGEMVGYNAETQTIGTKAMNFDVKRRDTEENIEFQPMYCVFDILLLNDEVLTNKPLRERKEILKKIFNPIDGRIVLSQYKEGSTNQDCADALNEAIDGREEGIMVKDPMSPYKPATRKGGWYKIKPEYVGGLMDELDVLVVGGYFGAGHRKGIISHFLCAVAVPTSEGSKPTKFYTFCRVGSGYSRKELYDVNQKLSADLKVFKKEKPPEWLEFAPPLRQKPDVYITPPKSVILQIKAAEITSSDQYRTECTLRFPRVEKIRTDKPWYDCLTTTDVEELRNKSSGKLASGYALADDDEDGPSKKRRKVTSRHVKPTVMSRFKGVDAATVTKVSEILLEKEICVINGPSSHPKSDLEKKVLELGGTICQNPGTDTYCVVADKVAVKVKNIISKGMYDVVKVDWLLRCFNNKREEKWVPSDMIHSSPDTVKKFAEDYDEHGDSYYNDCTEEELKKVFNKIQEEGTAKTLTQEDIADIEMKYFPHDSPYGLFRLCNVYLDNLCEINNPKTQIKGSTLEITALDLRYYGANLSQRITDSTSHVVVYSRDLSRLTTLRNLNKRREKKFRIVTEKWVQDSINNEKMQPERPYEPA